MILKQLHVASVGTCPDRSGRQISLSDSDLAELADSYSPHLHECKLSVDDVETAVALGAPAVLGHLDPRLVKAKGAMPAFGRVLRAIAKAGALLLDVELTDQLAGWIKQKLYDHVSLSWYDRDDPRNPTPGKLHIRHIGWLGAEPSAMKTLQLPELAESVVYQDLELVVPIEFAEASSMGEDEVTTTVDETAAVEAEPAVDTSTVDPVLMLTSVLQDGDKGYKGEISEFRPEPTAENMFLWSEEEQQFAGQFVDLSGSEEEVYDFKLSLNEDGSMTREYKRVVNEVDEAEAEAEVEMGECGDKRKYKEAGEPGMVTLTQAEYDELVMQAGLAKQMEMDAKRAEIAAVLQPIYDMGLISGLTDPMQVADAILSMDCHADKIGGEYEPLEFAEGVVSKSPLQTLLLALGSIAQNAVAPVEFGEMQLADPFIPTSAVGTRSPRGVVADPAGASLDAKARAYCEEKGWDPSNTRLYMKAIRSVS